MNLNDQELQIRINETTESIKNGCNNPYCNEVYCKSNKNHETIIMNDENILKIALNPSYNHCIYYITPSLVHNITPEFFLYNNIIKYVKYNILIYSFVNNIDAVKQQQMNYFEELDFSSMFTFFKLFQKYVDDSTLNKIIKLLDIFDVRILVFSLCFEWKSKYFFVFGQIFKHLTNDLKNKYYLKKYIEKMNKEQYMIAFTLVKEFVSHCFYTSQGERSDKIDFLMNALRLFEVFKEVNDNKQHVDYKQFYVNEISLDRNWSYDFYNVMSSKEGLFSYSFVIQLSSKIMILHTENQLKQKIESQRSIITNLNEDNMFLKLTIDRNHLLTSSMNQLISKTKDLRKELKVEFEGEMGVDQGGVSKEWFSLIIKEIFNEEYGLFYYNEQTRNYWFSNISSERSDYKLIGIVIGLAIYNNNILDVSFPSVLFKKLLNIHVTFDDYKEIDPDNYSSLMQLKSYSEESDVSNLDLYFETTIKVLDENKVVELIPNGSSILVTNENLDLYFASLIKYHCYTSCQQQFNEFKKGFDLVVNSLLIHNMNEHELEYTICGIQEYDFKALKQHSIYKGYTEDSKEVINFWSIVDEFNEKQKRLLLIFVTSSDRVPVGGLGNLKFIISKYGETNTLPTASTCFNILNLPPYTTKNEMKSKLMFAIENCRGFGLV